MKSWSLHSVAALSIPCTTTILHASQLSIWITISFALFFHIAMIVNLISVSLHNDCILPLLRNTLCITFSANCCTCFSNYYGEPPKACSAIFRAPSRVRLPPMNPEVWTNTHPAIPVSSDNCSSRRPRHGSGSGCLHRTEKPTRHDLQLLNTIASC